MTALPRVTVLMSVYNGARHLREAIESILGQTFRDFEFLIIDDASTDESPSIIASYGDPRIIVIRNETNQGLTRSLNRGLAAARADLVARQDADDRSYPERLARQVAFLDEQQDVAVIGAQARVIDGNGRPIAGEERKPLSSAAVRFALLFSNPIVHTAATFRRRLIAGLGGYDEHFVTSQDVELWSRVAERQEIRNLPERLVDLRVHGQSVSATRYTRGNVEQIERVLAANLKRFLRDDQAVRDWPKAWNAVVNTHVIADVPATRRASEMVDAMRAQFPELAGDADVDRIYSDVQLRVAEFFATRDRRLAWRAAVRAARRKPFTAMRRLPRLAAGALLGSSGLSAARSAAQRLGARVGRR